MPSINWAAAFTRYIAYKLHSGHFRLHKGYFSQEAESVCIFIAHLGLFPNKSLKISSLLLTKYNSVSYFKYRGNFNKCLKAFGTQRSILDRDLRQPIGYIKYRIIFFKGKTPEIVPKSCGHICSIFHNSKKGILAQLVAQWLSIYPWTKSSQVWLLVRVHAQVVEPIPRKGV